MIQLSTLPLAYHACPGGCGDRDVVPERFACQRCWWRLPTYLRSEILRSYRQLIESFNPYCDGSRLAHARALMLAQRWYENNPSRRRAVTS
jgi:hypothetical protein